MGLEALSPGRLKFIKDFNKASNRDGNAALQHIIKDMPLNVADGILNISGLDKYIEENLEGKFYYTEEQLEEMLNELRRLTQEAHDLSADGDEHLGRIVAVTSTANTGGATYQRVKGDLAEANKRNTAAANRASNAAKRASERAAQIEKDYNREASRRDKYVSSPSRALADYAGNK